MGKTTVPFSLIIWVDRFKNHIFTFNENNNFENFKIVSNKNRSKTFAICYDYDYINMWDASLGKFHASLDLGR